MAVAAAEIPLALYAHFPWCVRKCPYCDFNSHPLRGEVPERDYVDALLRDLDFELRDPEPRPLSSIFFGGGTPSLFSGAAVGRLLEGLARRLAFAPGIEITLEANPGTADAANFRGYRDAGVNRLSIGVQSLDAAKLRALGRIHGPGEARRAVDLARAAGFDNLNLDLMYALPGQDLAMALDDIERALALQPAHLSHYQLTLEPNTVFAARPPAGIPGHDQAWDMQEACQARLADAGFAQYEVSAYARAGRQCAHNLNYWRFGDYLGIGAGAHGKLTLPAGMDAQDAAAGTVLRRWKIKHPTAWLAHAGTPAAIGGDERIEGDRRAFDFMLNALRLVDGFALDMFEARTGLARGTIAAPLALARERDWIELDDGHVRPTELGRRFTNDVVALFLD